MPRVIFKCHHLKGGGATTVRRREYVKYIATREGVQKMDKSPKAEAAPRLLPATKKQRELAQQLLRDFPDALDLFEYEDYRSNPTRENATAFITAAIDHNLHLAVTRERYVDYIAMRPRAERVGTHGLFTMSGAPVVLEQVAGAAAAHPGNIWTPIFSLRREDASRLGFDNAEIWRCLLSAYAPEMAAHMRIQSGNFRWYAAYHDEGHHPHVHMVCWSIDPGEGFLTKEGIGRLKAGIANRVFRQELVEVYQRQTLHRDGLAAAARETMKRLAAQMQNGVLQNDNIERLTLHLAGRLRSLSGKKQYGYLKAPLKAMVDEIVDELAKDGRVAEAYRLWCNARLEVLRTYKKSPPHPGPLSAQKEFKHIRNIVIAEAEKLSRHKFTFERDALADAGAGGRDNDEPPAAQAPEEASDPDEPVPEAERPHMAWSNEYRQAKAYLYGTDEMPRDLGAAFSLFTQEAVAGNALAMHDLGRMYADGLGCEADAALSRCWYSKALTAFMAVEGEEADKYVEYRIGKMHAAGLGTVQDHSEAATWFRISAGKDYKYAQYSLGSLYYRGNGVEQNHAAAFALHTKSAAQGLGAASAFPYADFELGKMYRDGVGTQADTDASDAHFRKAYRGFVTLEQQGHDDKLQYRLGWMLENGVGTEADIPAAMAFYEKAAGVGNPHAQYAWAKHILRDDGASPEQVAQAVAMLNKAASAGNGAAVYALAKLCRDGRNPSGGGAVEKDIVRAVALFERAALEFENEYTAYALGKLYISGTDVPKEADAAVRWFTRAAGQGNQFAQYALGKLYLMGQDVPRDREAALHWFTLAAAQGNTYAQFFIDRIDQWRDPSAFLTASRLLYHMGRIFEDSMPHPNFGGAVIDRKLLRKLREKKIAQGHAPDDHLHPLAFQL